MKTRIFGMMVSVIFIGIIAANCQTNQQIQTNDSSYRAAVDNFHNSNWFFYGASTNGLACSLWISSRDLLQNGQHPPVCLVCITNETTNGIWVPLMPATNLFSIELFDPKGQPVQKTSFGKMFELPLTQKRISDWYNDKHWQIIRHGRASFVDSLEKAQIRSFSIPEAFEIKEAGEYALHVQMRLIGNGPDSSGQFPITWLPEVTAKVQIRTGDIAK
jgi:hypothetical protein